MKGRQQQGDQEASSHGLPLFGYLEGGAGRTDIHLANEPRTPQGQREKETA